MTDNNHPITPSFELMQQWSYDCPFTDPFNRELYIATQAARWAADQELKACCDLLEHGDLDRISAHALWERRRPKPPSLKEQALKSWKECWGSGFLVQKDSHADVIRRALEALPDD